MRAWALAAALVLVGCVSDAPPPEEASAAPEMGDPPLRAEEGTYDVPPLHPVGRAWTFEGVQEYNPDATIVVVVAEAAGDGYLMAGAGEDDVHYDALWGNPLFGRVGRDMQREDYRRWFDFPLRDGKTWAYSETMMVTASASTIQTPLGEEPGFVIAGADERIETRWEYAPSVGQIVSLFTRTKDGRVLDDLRLTRIDESLPWVWYELGETTSVGRPDEPAAFDVPAGFDAVLISAGGAAGSRVRVNDPAGTSWSGEFPAGEEWRHGVLPASPGKWTAAVIANPRVESAPPLPVDPPAGWAFAQIAPVKWVRSS